MPSFLNRVKSGAEKAAFEADKLRRVAQAQSALKGLQNDLENQITEMGRQALALYDAGELAQPELAAMGPAIDELRTKIAAQEVEVERVRQERQPGAAEAAAPTAPVASSTSPLTPAAMSPLETVSDAEGAAEAEAGEPPAAEAVVTERTCASCGHSTPEGVKFCPECGARL